MLLEKILKPLKYVSRGVVALPVAFAIAGFSHKAQAQPPALPMELRGFDLRETSSTGDSVFAYNKRNDSLLASYSLHPIDTSSTEEEKWVQNFFRFVIPTDPSGNNGAMEGDTIRFRGWDYWKGESELFPTKGIVIHEPGEIKRVDLQSENPNGIFEEAGRKIKDFELYQNFPNPFNSGTKIKYNLSEPGRVLLEVYDVLGRKVKNLVEGNQEPGEHEVYFNAKDFCSGVYFLTLRTENQTSTRKMSLVK